MALLYGGLVLLVGISLLFTSIVLLNSSISKVDRLKDAERHAETGGEQIAILEVGSTADVGELGVVLGVPPVAHVQAQLERASREKPLLGHEPRPVKEAIGGEMSLP